MLIEKELDKVKWLRDDRLRIKIENNGKVSVVTVLLENYNICFKMMMYEFVKTLLDDTGIIITTERNELSQVIFKVDKSSQMFLAKYIVDFVREWDIKASETTVANSDVITDGIWYSYK